MSKKQKLPKYKSHKTVGALKIGKIVRKDSFATITPKDKKYKPFTVNSHYLQRHNPRVGGYYVMYEDGYASYSTAEVFEKGYSKIKSDSNKDSENSLEEKKNELIDFENSLIEKEKSLTEKETETKDKEESLNKREIDLVAREALFVEREIALTEKEKKTVKKAKKTTVTKKNKEVKK